MPSRRKIVELLPFSCVTSSLGRFSLPLSKDIYSASGLINNVPAQVDSDVSEVGERRLSMLPISCKTEFLTSVGHHTRGAFSVKNVLVLLIVMTFVMRHFNSLRRLNAEEMAHRSFQQGRTMMARHLTPPYKGGILTETHEGRSERSNSVYNIMRLDKEDVHLSGLLAKPSE